MPVDSDQDRMRAPVAHNDRGHLKDLEACDLYALRIIARKLRVKRRNGLRKDQLIEAIQLSATDAQIRRALKIDWFDRHKQSIQTISLALAILSVAVGSLTVPEVQRRLHPIRPQAKPLVAFVPVVNTAKLTDDEWLSVAIPGMVQMEFVPSESIKPVPSETIARMMRDIQLAPAESYSLESLSTIRKYCGADIVIGGSFLLLDPRALRVDLHVQDAISGEFIAHSSERGEFQSLGVIVASNATRVRRLLKMPDRIEPQAQSVFPRDVETLRLYWMGLSRTHAFDTVAATELLEQALARDERFPLAHNSLAIAYSTLGKKQDAKRHSAIAVSQSSDLPSDIAVAIKARQLEIDSKWAEAMDVYRGLYAVDKSPDNAYNLERALLGAERIDEGLQFLDSLPTLPDYEAPRFGFIRVEALAYARRHAQAAELAGRNAALARAAGQKMMVARSNFQQAYELITLGKYSAAANAAKDAKSLFSQIGDRRGEAQATDYEGMALEPQGRFREAIELFDQSTKLYRTYADTRSLGVALLELGNSLAAVGRQQDAQSVYREAIESARTTKDTETEALARLSNGMAMQALGRAGEARREFDNVESSFGRADANIGSKATFSLAMLALQEDRLHDARLLLSESQKVADEDVQTNLARQLLDALIELQQRNDNGASSSVDRLFEMASRANHGSYIAAAHLVRGDVAIHRGVAADGWKELTQANKLLADRDAYELQGPRPDILKVRLLHLEGRLSEAKDLLNSLSTTADVRQQLEVSLWLGIISRAQRSPDYRAHLNAVSTNASRLGFTFIARQAGDALR